ncbi:hypothetical protein ABZX88_34415 [Kitasatospora aureofaciens]|uniref:hypothetical protein n=1 Tax=Kitasatospora aureofaciens TaxID=1894 RepID=UPI0033A8AA2E
MTTQRALTTAGLVYVNATGADAVASVYVPNNNRVRRRVTVLRQLEAGRCKRAAYRAARDDL